MFLMKNDTLALVYSVLVVYDLGHLGRGKRCQRGKSHSFNVQVADKAGLADRRANALLGELEESRSLLDSAERGKKQAEMELHDTRVKIIVITIITIILITSK